MSEVLIQAEGASKKFCRSLKRSLWYGLQDMASEALGLNGTHDRLRRDEFWAVKDVSFQLRRGECLGLIGHNGAGKTTLLKMLNGLIKPDEGRITMRGRVGALIALGAGFNPILTGRENIYVNGSVLGIPTKEISSRLQQIISFAEIGDFLDAPVRTYSSGMIVRLGFAIASSLNPDILLLDEVLAVGDIGFQAKCFNRLSELRKNGTGFILVSHSMHHVRRFCDSTLLLNRGRTVTCGPTPEAVRLYHEAAAHQGISDAESTDFSKPYGSGAIQILNAQFLNAQEQEIHCASNTEPVTLCLHYHIKRADIRLVNLDVVIRDRDGTLFQATNTDAGATLDLISPTGTINVRFSMLPFMTPEVRFFVTLLEGKSKEVLDWKRNLRLQISGDHHSAGRVLIPTEWQVKAHQTESSKSAAGHP